MLCLDFVTCLTILTSKSVSETELLQPLLYLSMFVTDVGIFSRLIHLRSFYENSNASGLDGITDQLRTLTRIML